MASALRLPPRGPRRRRLHRQHLQQDQQRRAVRSRAERRPTERRRLHRARPRRHRAGHRHRQRQRRCHQRHGQEEQGHAEGDALNICDGAYSDATYDLDIDARDNFSFGQYADASRLVSGAKGAGDTCKKAFAGIGVEPSPVDDVDRRMTERCDVAGNLIDLLVA